jgi:hypothetical protein
MGVMNKSSQMPADRLQSEIVSVTEYHQVNTSAELGLDRRYPFPTQAHEHHGGGRLKLLFVFEILNHPRISGN